MGVNSSAPAFMPGGSGRKTTSCDVGVLGKGHYIASEDEERIFLPLIIDSQQ